MKQEKGSLHRAMTTFRIAYFGGIVCMVLAMLFGRLAPPVLYMLGGAGILGMIGGLIYGSQAIRCPHCTSLLTGQDDEQEPAL